MSLIEMLQTASTGGSKNLIQVEINQTICGDVQTPPGTSSTPIQLHLFLCYDWG